MSDFAVCAYCPRLCRHVCPVAVGSGLESATPTSMSAAALLVESGRFDREFGIAATSMCLGCGACTEHCKLHVPVAEQLRAFRGQGAPPAPLAPIDGDAATVCVVTGQLDWSGAWGRREGRAVALLRTDDGLGHAAWKRGHDVPALVSAHFRGREVVTDSHAAAEVLHAARVHVRVLDAPKAELRFSTCHEAGAPANHQLACCGRREGFDAREPRAAADVAGENARRLGGRSAGCGDQACAEWLRRHGARVEGPGDALAR